MLQYSVPAVLLMKSPTIKAGHFNMLTFHMLSELQSTLYYVFPFPKARGWRTEFFHVVTSESLHLSLCSVETLTPLSPTLINLNIHLMALL